MNHWCYAILAALGIRPVFVKSNHRAIAYRAICRFGLIDHLEQDARRTQSDDFCAIDIL
jgi:hypothetical protein